MTITRVNSIAPRYVDFAIFLLPNARTSAINH